MRSCPARGLLTACALVAGVRGGLRDEQRELEAEWAASGRNRVLRHDQTLRRASAAELGAADLGAAAGERQLTTRKRVPMHGACAVVARSNVWVKETNELEPDPDTGEMLPTGPIVESRAEWDYRIKVDPWQVFGNVELDVIGEDIVIEHVWAADVLDISPLDNTGAHAGTRVKIELDSTPQDDQQFDIDGTGVPSSDPQIVGCTGLEPPPNDCKLTARYYMLNSFEGIVSSKVHLATWQEGAKVSLNFGTGDGDLEISEVWGADLVEPDAAAEAAGVVTFRLMPFNHHMPTDRRSCFGFDATPPFHQLPVLSCIPSRPFPPPPPPSPPAPPPAPPPYFETERADCFLGGRVTFVVMPSDTPGELWQVNVKLERWLIGAQLTLNFYGTLLKAHPLRISTVDPSDAVNQVAITAHSVILELRNTPVRDFNIWAYGLVEGLGKLACCCAEMPSPPPPPPAPPPSPRPPRTGPGRPPSPAVAYGTAESEWGRGIFGGDRAPPPSPPPLGAARVKEQATQYTALTGLMVTAVGLVSFIGLKVAKQAKQHRRLPHNLVPIPGHQGGFFGGAQGRHAPVRGTEDWAREEEEELGATTKLHIEVSASERCALRISMEAVTCMEDLQELVAEVCEEAGYTQLDDLAMAYKDEDGEFRTVTRSVTIEVLKVAPALRLAPAAGRKERKEKSAESGRAKGKAKGKSKGR